MAEILPFRGLYYNPSKVDLSKVLSPPYDVISPQEQEELYARDPRNVVQLEFGKETDRYASATKFVQDWRSDGTLNYDVEPSVYLLCQRFRDKSGRLIRRKGFLALCKLEDPETKTVLPHEKTFSKPKEDRLELLVHARAMFSPIFSIYVDPSRLLESIYDEVSKESPFLAGELESVSGDVWKVGDTETIGKLQALLRNRQVFIADGHHRYETALEYQRRRRSENRSHSGSEGYNYSLMYFTNVVEPGLVIYPIHRVIQGVRDFRREAFLAELAKQFNVEPVGTPERLVLELRARARFTFGIALKSDAPYYLAGLRDGSGIDKLIPQEIPRELKDLDVVLLHAYIIPQVLRVDTQSGQARIRMDFIKDEFKAIASVQKGHAQIAFLLNPTPVEQVQAVARAGLTMPQKSTYFYPKLPAGLVMYDLDRH